MIRIITTKSSNYYEAVKHVEEKGNEFLEFNPDTIRDIKTQLTTDQEIHDGLILWRVTLVITITMEP